MNDSGEFDDFRKSV